MLHRLLGAPQGCGDNMEAGAPLSWGGQVVRRSVLLLCYCVLHYDIRPEPKQDPGCACGEWGVQGSSHLNNEVTPF